MKKRFLSLFVVIAMVLATVGPVSYVNAQEEASKPRLEGGKLFYEVTDATLSGSATIAYGDWYGGCPGATNNSFVNNAGGNISLNIDVPYAGQYKVFITASTYNGTTDTYASVKVNNGDEYYILGVASEFCTWPVKGLSWYDYEGNSGFKDLKGGLWLEKGSNTIDIIYNNEWMLFDCVALQIDSVPLPEDDAAGIVQKKINALPEEITLENYRDVLSLKEQYDNLEEIQKFYISNVDKLNTAYEKAFDIGCKEYVQAYQVDDGKLVYEVEYGMRTGGAFVFEDESASAGKGINIAGGTIYLNVEVPIAGNYHISFWGKTNNSEQDKADYVYVNNGETTYFTYYSKTSYGTWTECRIGTENYDENGAFSPSALKEGIPLQKGSNVIEIRANWGYADYDKLVLTPAEDYISGDANEDTALNAKDIIRTKRIIAGVEGCSANFAADVDQNFVVDSIDAGEVRRILVK